MCPSCYNILEDFHLVKTSWTENQQKSFLETQVDATEEVSVSDDLENDHEEMIVKEDYIVPEDFEITVEYVEDLVDLHEVDQIEDETSEIEEKFETSQSRQRKKSPRIKPKIIPDEDKKKGKDVYQKLLKKCDECGKMIEKNRMEGHINKHRNVRPYECEEEQCGKKFYCKLLYRLHKTSIHTGSFVECDICQKSFPSQRSLYAHSLRHRNANRYNCECCERKFNNSNSLKRHMAIHSGIREWKCELCSAAFYRKFNLGENLRKIEQKICSRTSRCLVRGCG